MKFVQSLGVPASTGMHLLACASMLAACNPSGAGHILSVTVTGQGTVRSAPEGIECPDECQAKFGAGEVVQLTATPDASWHFVAWGGHCEASSEITMNGDLACTAKFLEGPGPEPDGTDDTDSSDAGDEAGGDADSAEEESTDGGDSDDDSDDSSDDSSDDDSDASSDDDTNECLDNIGCPEGDVCEAGACVPCSSDDSCLAGQSCTFGTCHLDFSDIFATPALAASGTTVQISVTASRSLPDDIDPTLTVAGHPATLLSRVDNPVFVFQYTPDSDIDSDGDQPIEVSGSDGVGTAWEAEETGVLTFDFTPPTDPSLAVTNTTTLGNIKYVTSATLNLALDAVGATNMEIAPQGSAGASQAYGTSGQYSHGGGDGNLTLCALFKDTAGNSAAPSCTSVIVDRTAPTTPSNVQLEGNGTRVTLTWGASSDAGSGVAGYRVYYGRSDSYTGFEAEEGASPVTASGLTQALRKLSYGGVTFHFSVRAVDALGNEGSGSPDQTHQTTTPFSWVYPRIGPSWSDRLQCLDASTCLATTGGSAFACGTTGGLFQTEDAGATWTMLDTNVAGPAYALAMRDNLVGLLGLCRDPGRVERTADGGKTWTPVTLPEAEDHSVQAITWLDASNVVVIARDASLKMFRSDDAGLSFDDVGSITGADWYGDGFITARVKTAGAEEFVMSGSGSSTLFKTQTAGSLSQWTVAYAGKGFYDAVFRSSTEGIAVAQDTIVHYEDGIWVAPLTTCGDATFSHVSWPGNQAWASGDTLLCVSGRGGQVWTPLANAYAQHPTVVSIRASTFVSDIKGYLATADINGPTLLRTDNNGTSWTLLQSNLYRDGNYTNPTGRIMTWGSGDVGWIGDPNSPTLYHGGLWRTSDGGATWQHMQDLNDTCETDGDPRLIAGYARLRNGTDGIILTGDAYPQLCRTWDNGTNWTFLPQATENQVWGIRAVDWVDSNEIYAVGDDTHASYTTDGNGWSRLPITDPASLPSASSDAISVAKTVHSGKSYLFMGTDDGQLFRSTNNSGTWGPWGQIAIADVGSVADFERIIFPTRGSVGYIIDEGQSEVLRSSDGGVTWVRVDPAGGDSIRQVQCVSDTKCFFLSSTDIFVTTDSFSTARNLTTGVPGFASFPETLVAFPSGRQYVSGREQVLRTDSDWE